MFSRMKKTATAAFVVVPMLTLSAAAQQIGEPLVLSDPLLEAIQSDVRSAEPPSLNELRNPSSTFYKERGTFTVDGAKVSLIENAARGVGIRGGYAEEATRINDLLMQRYRNALNRRYNFKPAPSTVGLCGSSCRDARSSGSPALRPQLSLSDKRQL